VESFDKTPGSFQPMNFLRRLIDHGVVDAGTVDDVGDQQAPRREP